MSAIDHRLSLDEGFRLFLADNPHVVPLLAQMARAAKAEGRTRMGMKRLIEGLRWDTSVETKDREFKWNNNWTSRLVREVQRVAPDVADMFETRKLATVPALSPAPDDEHNDSQPRQLGLALEGA